MILESSQVGTGRSLETCGETGLLAGTWALGMGSRGRGREGREIVSSSCTGPTHPCIVPRLQGLLLGEGGEALGPWPVLPGPVLCWGLVSRRRRLEG